MFVCVYKHIRITCIFLGLGKDDDFGALLVNNLLHDALQLAWLIVVLAHLQKL